MIVNLDRDTAARARAARLGEFSVYQLIETAAIAQAVLDNPAHQARMDGFLRWLMAQIPTDSAERVGPCTRLS